MVPLALDAPMYECPPPRGAILRLFAVANATAFWTSSCDETVTTAAGVELL